MEGAPSDPEMARKAAPPTEPHDVETLGTDAGAGPSVPVAKAASQDDILMYGRKVHVHGELAKHETHVPQHAPQGPINFAAVAREELHDVHVNPPPVKLRSGKLTGVEMWDKVNSPKAHN